MIYRKIQRILIVTLLFLSIGATTVSSQEIKCKVTVNADQVEGSNKQMFQTLQESISEFVNNTKWTTLVFAESERIECAMMIIVNSVTTEGLVDATLQIQCKRPVFGTSYSTPLLNMKDEEFTFQYQEFDRLEYQPPQVTSNLSAMIAYYCFLVIGYDMDSFSRLGGTVCFQACEEIVNAARSSSMDNSEINGWKSIGSNRNRYQIISNLLDEAFKPYRNYFYEYHRLGLDVMSQNVNNGRAIIAQGMPVLKDAYHARPSSCIVNLFFDAKSDEIASLFEKAPDSEKKSVVKILSDIDPTRLNTTYEKLNP